MRRILIFIAFLVYPLSGNSQNIIDLIQKLPNGIIAKNIQVCQDAITKYSNDKEDKKVIYIEDNVKWDFEFTLIDIKNGYAEFISSHIGGQRTTSGSVCYWNKADGCKLIGVVEDYAGPWAFGESEIEFYQLSKDLSKIEKVPTENILSELDYPKKAFKEFAVESFKNDKNRICVINKGIDIYYRIELPRDGKNIIVVLDEIDCDENWLLDLFNNYTISHKSISYIWFKDQFYREKVEK